jgi:outer membrane protein TolC
MRTRILTLTALILALASSVAAAQTPAGADSLLNRLTAEAVASAPALLRSAAFAQAASTRVRAAGALPDPRVSVGVMDLTLPRFEFRESNFTEIDVEISQQVPWPGTLGSQTRAAHAMAREATSQTSSLRRTVVVRVAALYYRLRYVVTAMQSVSRQRNLLQSAVDISTARYGTGSVSQSDPLQARIALARLETEDASLLAEESGLRADLRAVRGIRALEQLPVAPIDPDSVHVISRDAAGRHATQLTMDDPLAGHPRLDARRAEIEAAEQTAKVEALAARPDFEVLARYGARPLGADFFSAFVGVRVPLWAGRKQRLLARAARIDAAAAQRGLEEDQDALNAELERTLADLHADATRLSLLVESVLPVTREAVAATLRGYRTGQTDFLSVLTAEDARYRAELEASEVAAQHLTHLVMLEQLLTSEDTP